MISEQSQSSSTDLGQDIPKKSLELPTDNKPKEIRKKSILKIKEESHDIGSKSSLKDEFKTPQTALI